MIKIKTFIITIVSAIVIIVGIYLYARHKINSEIDIVKKELERQKDEKIKEQSQLYKVQNDSIKKLISENEKFRSQSAYWYNQALQNSVNPDYNIDFLTAYGIISDSKYRPGE